MNRNITILPADKGGATGVLTTEEYMEKAIQYHSNATTYGVLTSDPTPKQTRAIRRTLGRLVREKVLPKAAVHVTSPINTSIARSCGLPKIHKPNNPPHTSCQNGCLATSGHSKQDQSTAFSTPDNFWRARSIPT